MPGQGSTHFLLMHELLVGQSEFKMHSGRQFGAVPIILARQAHWACPETTEHCALAPQGGGLQGFGGRGSTSTGSGIGGGTGARKGNPISTHATLLDSVSNHAY